MHEEPEVHPYLRRRVEGSHPPVTTNSEYQRLMWKIFYYDKRYDKHEIAEHLGIAVDTFHAYCNGDLRLHIDTAVAVAHWVAQRNPKDRDLIDYLLPDGFVCIPILKGAMKTTLHEIIDLAVDIHKKITKGEKHDYRHDRAEQER